MRPWQSRFAGLILVNLCLYRLSDVFRELGTSNPLHYVFCQRHDCKLLVTVFNKDPDEQQEVFRPQVANRI